MDSCFIAATYRRLISEPNKQFFSYSGEVNPLNISVRQNTVLFKRSLTRLNQTPQFQEKTTPAMYV